jgi:hypothetical protein
MRTGDNYVDNYRPRIEYRDVESYKNGGRFVSLENEKCDLLYIDGPYLNRAGGKFATYTGKPVYYDFERILENYLPKVIMVEGRTDTVEEILNSHYAKNYDFCGELTWALERNRYLMPLGSVTIRYSHASNSHIM